MADQHALGPEFLTWANERTGGICPLCEVEIEYTPLGTNNEQTEHRIECGCTVIECQANPDEPNDDENALGELTRLSWELHQDEDEP